MSSRTFLFLFLCMTLLPFEGWPSSRPRNKLRPDAVKKIYNLQYYFITNVGQLDHRVKYYAVNGSTVIYFTDDGIYFCFIKNEAQQDYIDRISDLKKRSSEFLIGRAIREVVKMTPLGALKDFKIRGAGLQEAKFNFFLGNDPKRWQSNIDAYQSVIYQEVYPGIDLKFYGSQSGQLEYDITVKPWADPRKVKFVFEGIEGLSIDKAKNIIVQLRHGTLVHQCPKIYQRIGTKIVEVPGSFKIHSDGRSRKFAFGLDFPCYAKNYTLIIDPVVSFSTYFGGADADTFASVDLAAGFLYMTGSTDSLDFPITPGAYQTTLQKSEGFITKISQDGNSIVYSTYIGGSGGDQCHAIKVDDTGAAYVACFTNSEDFPTVNPFQPNRNGDADSTVSKLNPEGNALMYSTYLGGSDFVDQILGIGLYNHQLYVAGVTTSTDFPLYNPLQPNYGGGTHDGFVAVFSEEGNELIYSTYLGGSKTDYLFGVSVLASGETFVAGSTNSSDFPVTRGAFDTLCGNGLYCADAFVSKITADGSELVYSTYLGGTSTDNAYAVASDSAGAAYVAGSTISDDFPTLNAAQSLRSNRSIDAFVTKINPDGTALVYSTFLGAWATEEAFGIAVDDAGSAYVIGQVNGGYLWPTNFPTIKPLPFKCHEDADPFVTKVSPEGNFWEYSTCVGGSSTDAVADIVVDGARAAYVVGDTISDDFPVRNAIQPNRAGFYDGFITKISCDSVIGPASFENAGFATFTIDLCLPRNSDSVIQYSTSDGSAVAGNDYVATSGTVTIPAGELQGSIQIPLLDDNVLEGEEDFFLNVTSSDIDLGGFPVRASLLDTEGFLYDNFEDGITDWNVIKSSWYEGGGYLTGWSIRKAEIFAPVPWTPSGSSGCDNCTIETTIKITNGDPFKIMLEAWYQNGNNKVELILNELTNKWILKQRSGGKLVAKSKAADTFAPFVPYNVVLSFDGANFNLSVNGQQMITMKAGAQPFGNVGFKTKNYMTGIFEQIRVY